MRCRLGCPVKHRVWGVQIQAPVCAHHVVDLRGLVLLARFDERDGIIHA